MSADTQLLRNAKSRVCAWHGCPWLPGLKTQPGNAHLRQAGGHHRIGRGVPVLQLLCHRREGGSSSLRQISKFVLLVTLS